MEWYCFKCKEKMIEKGVWMTYLDILRSVLGLKCPKCNAAYVTEQTVMETVGPGEEMLESKF